MTLVRAASLVLAIALGWSAVAKLLDLPGTRVAFESLGLRRARQLALVVPIVESATAVLLVVAPRVGGSIALFLLVAFTVVLADVLRRGLVVRCACFGALTDAPVGRRDVVRNGLLIVLALIVALA